MSLYDIECYDFDDFKSKHTNIHTKICELASKYGINLSAYEFSQYLKYSEVEDITYGHKIDEDVCFNIQFYEGKLENIFISKD